MKKELLSIVVPVYNGQKYIRECIDSIRRQTYSEIEIIIVDDGSTDETSKICKKMVFEDERVRYFYQENAGVTMARTEGVIEARGDYIAFVDSDDYVDNKIYERMMAYVEDYDLVSCSVVQEMSKGHSVIVHDEFKGGYSTLEDVQRIWINMLYDFEKEKLHPIFSVVYNKIFRKKKLLPILEKMDTNINSGEDTCVSLQYLLKCDSAYFLREPLYYYRYNEFSITHSKNVKMLENVARIYNLLKPVFDNHSMAEQLNKQLEKWIITLSLQAINTDMGFAWENNIPRYWVNIDEFIGKKIAVYGAGNIGRDVVWQCYKRNQEIQIWMDRDYLQYQELGLNVKSIHELKNKELTEGLDAILIAINSKQIVEQVKENLINYGIPEQKIVWKEAIRIF